MTIGLRLQQITVDGDGIYSVYAEAYDIDTDKVIKRKCVQGKTKEEIKDALRPYWQKVKAGYDKHQLIKTIAKAALSELEAE